MSVISAISNGIRPHQTIDRGSFSPAYPFDLGPDEMLLTQTIVGNQEIIAPNFLGLVQRAYKASPVVFGLIMNRAHLFSEVRFQMRDRVGGRLGEPFGGTQLSIIEKPWPGATTRDLLSLAEVMNACAGNFFAHRKGDRLRVMRPDWTSIVLGSMEDEAVGPLDLSAEVIAYVYEEGGPWSQSEPLVLAPEEVVHYKPTPDPEAPWRGMSYLSPIIQELCADQELVSHKRKYLQGGATPNLGLVLDPQKLNIKTPEDFDKWVTKFLEKRDNYSGGNPYKMLFVAGGADPKVLGANLDQIDFSKVQGSGEVRMAVAAMVHPAIVAIEAGLQGSALNAGNFEAAFRQFANGTMRPLWGTMAGALQKVVPMPRPNTELWPDDRDVAALQEDVQKLAETFKTDAETASALFMAGWDPDSIINAIAAKDLRLLRGKHIGAPSVQVQPTGSSNGSSNGQRQPAQA